jgi:hypothetical protein
MKKGTKVNVKSINKNGVVMSSSNNRVSVMMEDGTAKVFDANDVEMLKSSAKVKAKTKYAKKVGVGKDNSWINSYKKPIKTSDVAEFLNSTKNDEHKYSLWNKEVGVTYAYNGKLYANNGQKLPN